VSGAQIITFGCRLNAYEAEIMRGHAAAAGLDDAVIVNTCSARRARLSAAHGANNRTRALSSPAARRRSIPAATPPCPRSTG